MIEQKIHFVTGKGGVGKSCVALALASHLSNQGRKVLLVELGQISFFKDHLQTPIAYNPISPYKKNLSIALWSGSDCLKEYAMHLLKIEALYNLFFENKLSKSLIEIAPSLPELSILGKITSGIRHIGPKLDYDEIVVDCFATGHMISLLKAPRGMLEAISFGPMGEQCRGILNVIKNKEICKYWIVTLPEELPVVESIELAQGIYSETQIKPHLVINKVSDEQTIKKLTTSSAGTPSFGTEANFLTTLNDRINQENLFINQLINSEAFDVLNNNIHNFENLNSELQNSNLFFKIPFIFENDSQKVEAEMTKSFSFANSTASHSSTATSTSTSTSNPSSTLKNDVLNRNGRDE